LFHLATIRKFKKPSQDYTFVGESLSLLSMPHLKMRLTGGCIVSSINTFKEVY